MSRRSEVLPYPDEQIGGGNRCECDKERRNQVIDHENDSTNRHAQRGGQEVDEDWARQSITPSA